LTVAGSQAKGLATASSDIDYLAVCVHARESYLLQRIGRQYRLKMDIDGIVVEGHVLDILGAYEYNFRGKGQIALEIFRGICLWQTPHSDIMESLWLRVYQPSILNSVGNIRSYRSKKWPSHETPGHASCKMVCDCMHHVLLLLFMDQHRSVPPPLDFDELVNAVDELEAATKDWLRDLRDCRLKDKNTDESIEDPILLELVERALQVQPFETDTNAHVRQEVEEHFLSLMMQ